MRKIHKSIVHSSLQTDLSFGHLSCSFNCKSFSLRTGSTVRSYTCLKDGWKRAKSQARLSDDVKREPPARTEHDPSTIGQNGAILTYQARISPLDRRFGRVHTRIRSVQTVHSGSRQGLPVKSRP